jgi:hypothetical protein
VSFVRFVRLHRKLSGYLCAFFIAPLPAIYSFGIRSDVETSMCVYKFGLTVVKNNIIIIIIKFKTISVI